MDSRPQYGVPISATMAAFPSNTISGIRAPLTVDESDSEYSGSSPRSRRSSIANSYYSNSEIEHEGFEGEEILQENHLLRENGFYEPSGETVQDNIFMNRNGFSRISVRSPDEDFAQESGAVDGDSFFRPLVGNPDEELARESGSDDRSSILRSSVGNPYEKARNVVSNVNDSDDSRSFLSDSGDELVENEENSENGPTPIADIIKIPVVQKAHIPIAKISRESDDEDDGSQGSEVVEDEGFLEIVRVPSFEVLSRLNSTPKVRISEADDDVSQAEDEDTVEMEFVKDLLISNDGVLDPEDADEHIDVEDIIKCVIAFDKVQDGGPDVRKNDKANYLAVNEDLFDLVEKIQEIDVTEDLEKCVDSVDCSTTGLDDKFQEIDVSGDRGNCRDSVDCTKIGFDDNFQELDVANDWGKCVDSVDCTNTGLDDEFQDIDATDDQEKCVDSVDCTNSDLDDEVQDIDATDDQEKCVDSVDCTNSDLDDEVQDIDATDDQEKCVDSIDCDNTGLDDNFLSSQNVENEKPVAGIEQTIVECFSSVGPHGNRSLYQRVDDIKSVAPELLELPEALTANVLKNMSGIHLGYASSTGSDDCQSVFEVTISDQEEIKEAQNSEEFSVEIEVKSSNNFNENKATVVEMARDSVTMSHEEIFLDRSQESDCQIVSGSDEPQSVDDVDNCTLESGSADLGSIFVSDLEEALSEGERKKPERIQQMQVKYLRLIHQLGHSLEDSIASTVLRQLSISEPNSLTRDSFPIKGDFDLSLCILVIGKTGVGKSATINSIFGERKATVNAFEPTTAHVKEINGEINGVKVKVFDTPGLRISPVDQMCNRKILLSIKKIMQKSPPDVVLYVERLDTQFTNFNDIPLLRSVTLCLGPSIWKKSVLAFTHADLVPPEGPDGCPVSYREFVVQQSRAFQQLIGRSSSGCMVPVSLVENHSVYNGENRRLNLLFFCCSVKILTELSSVVEIDSPVNCLKVFLRYFLEPSCRILTRLVFESYHDFGCDGFPEVSSVQLTKDKKKLDIKLQSSVSGQLLIAALALLPIVKAVSDRFFVRSADD